MAHAEPARLGEERQAVRAVADRDLLHELPGGGVDHVDLGVVPAAEPQLLAVAADAAHVRTAAEVPGAVDLVGREVDDRHRTRAAVGHVELRAVAAGAPAVRSLAGTAA